MDNVKDQINLTLVPIDFSESSIVALQQAISMVKTVGDAANITLLHTIEGANFPMVSDVSQMKGIDQQHALAVEGAWIRMQKIVEAQKAESANIEFHYLVTAGKAYRAISETAEKVKASIIVMGTHGSSGIQAFAGSNASKVIQLSPCPVVVIKKQPRNKGCKNIVLPLDLTIESKQKVNFAAKFAKKYGSTVHILTMRESDEFLANKLENNLTQVEIILAEQGIPTTSTVLNASGGNFVKQTLAWAEGKDADLIIIMSQQDRDIAEFFFGSYSQQIVNRSNIPVLAVNPNHQLEYSMKYNY